MTEGGAEGGSTAAPRGKAPSLGAAVLFLVGIWLLFLVGGTILQLTLGEVGLAVTQISLLIVPTILFIHLRGYGLARTLSLRLPKGAQVLGALLLLVGGVQAAWLLVWVQTLFIPVPTEYLESMAGVLEADSPARFLWLVFLVALLPAVAEEMIFRGVLLSALRERLPGFRAALWSGIVFGLFHLLPSTAIRFLPTAWLGVLLGIVVVATGSLPLAVLLHFLNNASILAASAFPNFSDQATDVEVAPPLVTIPAAIFFLWLGGSILWKGKSESSGSTPSVASG